MAHSIIEKQIPVVESILMHWHAIIGDDYRGYKNHVYRMIHFCLSLSHCSDEQRQKIIIAGCFHDIGIWTARTIDYILPSIVHADAYLQKNNCQQWSAEIALMISEHHKITAYTNASYPLVEVFRKGDLVDFSLGLFKFGLSDAYIRSVQSTFPNAGFHKNLAKLAGKWFVKHPLNPAPMMKW